MLVMREQYCGKEPHLLSVYFDGNVANGCLFATYLSRDGIAKRLSYDHKGSDVQEAKRIVDAGGFVLNNRVNGMQP